MPFEFASEFDHALDKAWEQFKKMYPQVGETHYQCFRYAFAQGWGDCRLKLDEALDKAEG